MQFLCNFLGIWPLLFRALCNKRNVLSEINTAIVNRHYAQTSNDWYLSHFIWCHGQNVNAKSLFWLLKRHRLQKLPVNIFYPKSWSLVYTNMNDRVCKLQNKLSHCYYLKQYPAQSKHEWNWITIQTYFECPYQSNLQFSVSIPTYIRLDA